MKKILLACLLPFVLQSVYAQSSSENLCNPKSSANTTLSQGLPSYNVTIALNKINNNQVSQSFNMEGNAALGQPFVFANINKIAYIKAVNNVDGIQKITPGTINDGFNGYIEPMLVNNKVVTNVCFNLTDLLELAPKTIDAGTIQLPVTKENRINYTFDFSKNPVQKIKLSEEVELVISSKLVTL